MTNDIFKYEMLHLYEQKSTSRDDLVREARKVMREMTRQMKEGVCGSPEVETLMLTLVTQLETVQGKKKYGYLPKKVKATVDEIVDQIEKLSVVDQCYQVWWELQCEIEDYYSERERIASSPLPAKGVPPDQERGHTGSGAHPFGRDQL